MSTSSPQHLHAHTGQQGYVYTGHVCMLLLHCCWCCWCSNQIYVCITLESAMWSPLKAANVGQKKGNRNPPYLKLQSRLTGDPKSGLKSNLLLPARPTRLHFAPRPVAGAGGGVHRLPSDDPGDQDEPVQAGQRRRGRGPQRPGDAASRVRRCSASRFFAFTFSQRFALKRWCLCVCFFCFVF